MMAFFGKFVSFAASEQPLTTGGMGSRVTRSTYRRCRPSAAGRSARKAAYKPPYRTSDKL
jgi:hypothetical protein